VKYVRKSEKKVKENIFIELKINRSTLNHLRVKRNSLKVRASGLYLQVTDYNGHKNLTAFSLNIGVLLVFL